MTSMFNYNECNLSALLDTPAGKSDSHFQVPQWQRKYQWDKEKEVARLINDIFDNIGRPYFLGPIILVAPTGANSKDSVELVDGQQRIATLSIFIRALMDYAQKRRNDGSIPDRFHPEMDELQISLKPKIVKGILMRNDPVIHLSHKIDKFFRDEIILGEGEKAKKLVALRKAKHLSIIKLIDAYLKIWENLEQRYDSRNGENLVSDLRILHNSILTEKIFLTITVTSYSDAYTVFETINDRGKRLPPSDLVKNLCFKKLAEPKPMEVGFAKEDLDNFERDWDDAEERVKDFPLFMWHAWVSCYEHCPKSGLFSKVEDKVKGMNSEQVFDFITTLVIDDSRHYEKYENPTKESDVEKKHYLEMLKAMDATRCYPLLLGIDYARKKETITKQQANSLFKVITNLTFWYSGICNNDAKKLESIYYDLAPKLRNMEKQQSNDIVNAALNRLREQFPVEDNCEVNFNNRLFADKGFAKMVLQEIVKKQHPGELTLRGPKEVWLEHILPVRPDKSWQKVFPDENEREEYTYKLGNQTLLMGSKNQELQNKSFKDKKIKYAESSLGMTNALVEIDEWNKKSIDNRTKQLFEPSKKIWEVPEFRQKEHDMPSQQ